MKITSLKNIIFNWWKKDYQVAIRLDPTTDPSDKNKGVKMSIAMVAKMILSIHKESDDLKITKTNLAGFI